MKIDVQVISKDMIKPSTPTPDQLSSYQFSFLDQISPPVHIPLIYFFNLELDQQLSRDYISNHLKTSLSKVLSGFYLLAGSVKDNSLACNDQGVPFLEAQISCPLSEVLQKPCPVELNQLLPDHTTEDCLAIQVNFFTCLNFAIGVRISHKIADGSSVITFVNRWAAVARGDTDMFRTELIAAKLFPPIDVWGYDRKIRPSDNNVVLKSFVFNDSVITKLREKYADQIYPTRVEALSSFIWSRYQSSTDTKIGPEKTLLLAHAVNLRKRMNPQLPDDLFGNYYRPAFIIASDATEEDCAKKIRDSIGNINEDFVKKLQNGSDEYNLLTRAADNVKKGEIFTFNYTSLCRYPVYEADFGWGRPEWVAWGGLPYKNFVVLMDTKSRDGIEAWMHLTEEDMAKFEADHELLACLS